MASPGAGRKVTEKHNPAIPERLLCWYDHHHRELPWRIGPAARSRGVTPDPYHVWLSEIMLQQTTVEAVKPYYRAFLELWPDIAALASAETDSVMKAWAGLGYYSRARNLKKCADDVVSRFGGSFPADEAALKRLPGIGDYTAAAIAAIAFDRKAAVVDGNVERVIARHEAIEAPMPGAKRHIREVVERITPVSRPGDFAQAMMDLGALVCTPRRPDCARCPLADTCMGLASGDPQVFPVRASKPEKPLRRAAAFVAVRNDGAVLLRKRPERGLLGGMSEVPTSVFTAHKDGDTTARAAPFDGEWKSTAIAGHVFTHFRLELITYRCDTVAMPAPGGFWWAARRDLDGEALPTVMRKAIAAAGIEIGKGRARKSARGKGL